MRWCADVQMICWLCNLTTAKRSQSSEPVPTAAFSNPTTLEIDDKTCGNNNNYKFIL
ncbi:hypothetical protein Mucpa_4054 [Mucilaginibacter paludis DSM 18603]|uniref:Uncharacterized protein n=1 Tax=Mucilaginibacter paludis DSM 18603 TaxID=714943 RepID=H1Y096_9SPHI|nr:hypothetical protein Mucpa_4054 [Mucilaginibacter paludis DSM 18603]